MSLIMTDSGHNKLQNVAIRDFQLMAKIYDAIAENVKYYGLCLLKQNRPEEPGTSNNRKNLMMLYLTAETRRNISHL